MPLTNETSDPVPMSLELHTRFSFARSLSACVTMLLCACSDCNVEHERVEAFLANDANFECQSDDDCATADVGCLQIEDTLCGQIGMSRRASESREWQKLRASLVDCLGVETCTSCNAALIPGCHKGSCR